MDDLISRQGAIDAIIADKIEDGLPVITDTQERDFEVFNSSCDRHAKILKELPSAQKKGKWIKCGWSIRCSECGYDMPYTVRNYCPNCGADMRGDTDD